MPRHLWLDCETCDLICILVEVTAVPIQVVDGGVAHCIAALAGFLEAVAGQVPAGLRAARPCP